MFATRSTPSRPNPPASDPTGPAQPAWRNSLANTTNGCSATDTATGHHNSTAPSNRSANPAPSTRTVTGSTRPPRLRRRTRTRLKPISPMAQSRNSHVNASTSAHGPERYRAPTGVREPASPDAPRLTLGSSSIAAAALVLITRTAWARGTRMGGSGPSRSDPFFRSCAHDVHEGRGTGHWAPLQMREKPLACEGYPFGRRRRPAATGVGPPGLEPGASSLSGMRSNQAELWARNESVMVASQVDDESGRRRGLRELE